MIWSARNRQQSNDVPYQKPRDSGLGRIFEGNQGPLAVQNPNRCIVPPERAVSPAKKISDDVIQIFLAELAPGVIEKILRFEAKTDDLPAFLPESKIFQYIPRFDKL
jgi:hypothetical protein